MVRYRRDIDGLRAVAVVPVVLFHAGMSTFSGGFVGVDVFFVISGYLITQQLLTTEKSGWRAIADFYERRVRRIAPALLSMLGALLVVTAIITPAVDALRNAKNVVAALFFAANIRFYAGTGYFAGAAEDEPLLHTWSLAVEEQYYLAFPIVVLALRSLGRRTFAIVLMLFAVASLDLSQAVLAADPVYAFYLLPARAWELLVGAVLATVGLGAAVRSAGREATAAVGLLMIVVPIFAYDRFVPFPGLAALPPVLGAALLIASAENTFVGRCLATRGLVWIGVISYSLYLWHWPIFVVARQTLGRSELWGTLLLIAASFAAAYLSYRFVERPFRDRAMPSGRLLLITGAAAAAIAATAAAFILSGGWPSRSPAAERLHQSTARAEYEFQLNPCLTKTATLPPAASCGLGVPARAFDGILWGDSHAAHWAPMIDQAAVAGGHRFRQLTKAGCPPIPVAHMFPLDADRGTCPTFNASVLDYLLANPDIHYVVLAANWQGLTEGDLRVADRGTAPSLVESRRYARQVVEQLTAMLRANGKIVIAIGQTPIPDENVVLCMGRRLAIGASASSCARSSLRMARHRDRAAAEMLRPVARGERPGYLSPLKRFCGPFFCAATDAGRSLYLDAAHLSPLGARRLAPDFERLLARISTDR